MCFGSGECLESMCVHRLPIMNLVLEGWPGSRVTRELENRLPWGKDFCAWWKGIN
jgi:hypothetical protein